MVTVEVKQTGGLVTEAEEHVESVDEVFTDSLTLADS